MIGRQYAIGIGKETTRGTAVAPSVFVPLTETPFFINKNEGLKDESGYGVITNIADRVISKEWSEGDLQGNIQSKSFGYFLLCALGQVSSQPVPGESTVYKHTFTMANNNEHPTLSITAKNAHKQLTHALCALQSLKISCEVGKWVTFTASMIGKKGEETSHTVSYSDDNEFFSKMLKIKLADDIAGLSGAEEIKAQTFDITIEKNVDAMYALGDGEPYNMKNNEMTVEGSMSFYFDDTTIEELCAQAKQQSLQIKAVHNKTIGTNSKNSLVITVAKTQLKDFEPSGGLGDQTTQSVKFNGMYDLNNAEFLTIDLVNEQNNY